MGDTPNWFICPVARRNPVYDYANRFGLSHRNRYSYPPGHDKIVRTGRTKPNSSRRRGSRTSDLAHEYECECGHKGWTVLVDILRFPLKDAA